MKIYHYEPQSGVYLGSEEAEEDRYMPGRWAIPLHATEIEPPEVTKKQLAIFNEKDQVWSVIDNPHYTPDYIIARQSEYPSVFDYIDGVVKNDQQQINDYIKKCQEVKKKYPKTED